MPKIYTKYLILFLLIGSYTSYLTAQTDPAKPNILLIIADDLGVDASNGYQDSDILPNTPNLDALRADGLTFKNAWAAPKCTPTRANIMSGKYGIKTGVTGTPGNLETTHTSIFKELNSRTNGAYANALIGKWHLSAPADYTDPRQHGIDYYEGSFTSGVADYYNWEKISNETAFMETEYATTYFTNQAIDWIDRQNQPWFMWLAHNAPHSPFQVPPSDLYTSTNVNNNQGKYIAMIEAMDAEIGRLMSNIAPDVLANTTIIYIGDNGTPNGVLQNYPNRHGKASLYQGGVHVPMSVTGAGVTRQNEEESAMIHAIDIYATILALAGSELSGGVYNSLSFKHLLSNPDGAKRAYNYSELDNDWTIRNSQYKLIQLADGTQEFYDLMADPLEENDLITALTTEQLTIKIDLETEGAQIRTGWSCKDFILNGDEVTVDDCDASITPSDCANDNATSYTNIGCCNSQEHPNAYYETVEGDKRIVYSNNYPNHDFCFASNRMPEPIYGIYDLAATPQKAATITEVVRDNGRPRMHFGIALNGVAFAPAPAMPFIFENPNTGEFNWDWVFEPTNNQGDGQDKVALDCASAHTGPQGYHYHGNMFEYVETVQVGISSATTSPDSPMHIGWAADGFPILYRFGPDGAGGLSLLQPSYQLKTGERPGDGITSPCGPYNGKYTNDYEYNATLGDLDECNGIDRNVIISTTNGDETFNYFYVITDSFPQVPRCVVGTPADVFIDGNENLTFIDNDNDGYISTIDCDDNNAAIFPNAEDIPNNGIDEDCDGMDEITTSIPTCSNPTQITSEINRPRRAIIRWKNIADVDRYFVQIRVKGNVSWLVNTNVYENKVYVYAPANTYEIQIQANCNDGETSNFSIPYEFTISNNQLTDRVAQTNSNNETAQIVITELQINAARNNGISEKVLIFPNPASDLLILQTQTDLENDVGVRLFDINGKEVVKIKLLKGSNTNTIDVENLIGGSYILELREGSNRSQHKVLIMKNN